MIDGNLEEYVDLRVLGSVSAGDAFGRVGMGPFSAHFSLPAALRGHFTPRDADSTRKLNSTGRRCPLQPNEATHIIDQVHHADLHGRTRHPDGTYEYAAHPVFLIRKYVFDTGAHS